MTTTPTTETDQTTVQRLYKVAEAAEILGASPSYIYARLDDGTLPYVDLGQGTTRAKTRIRATDLETFITDRTYTNTPDQETAA
ncbi:helix-turn-helix domain-containing protein [Rothia koreensis]|uniref:helix-turn-helix domain-containing protein n=1 Tax=Rothia koreensis TaxID=592378 RepID=UPI0037C897CC